MTLQDLPHDSEPSIVAPPAAGLLTRIAKLVNFAQQRWLSWRLRRAAERWNADEAESFFAVLLARQGGDLRTTPSLSGAALRAARASERSERWSPASRLWTWYARSSGDSNKAGRNIVRCARTTTKKGHDQPAVAEALECWRCLASIEPNSPEAMQGMAWCHTALARFDEGASNWAAARIHWSEVLDLAPDNAAAAQGLHRASAEEAAASSRNAARARALSEHLGRVTGPEYSAQCAAALPLLELGAPELALEFVGRALRESRGTEALVLLFRCHTAQARFELAAAALNEYAQSGNIGSIPAAEIRSLLSNTAPHLLASETIARVAGCYLQDGTILAALVPHLIANRLRTELATAADTASPGKGAWPEVVVLEAARDLLGTEERDRALRLLARFSAAPNVAQAFAVLADAYPSGQVDDVVAGTADASEEARFASLLGLAEYHTGKGEWLAATEVLRRIGDAGAAQRLYRHDRVRLGALVGQLSGLACDRSSTKALVQFVCGLVSERTKAFFAGPQFAAVCEHINAAWEFQNAHESGRVGRFREHYFAHHMERREDQLVDSFSTEFALCEAVLRYFAAVARVRAVERIPVPAELRGRLAQPCLRLGGGHAADALMSYAVLRERPNCDLKSETLFAQLAGWYVSRFMSRNHVPSCCIGPDVLVHFNTVARQHLEIGIVVTEFAKFLLAESPDVFLRYRLENPLDALLLCVDAIPFLSTHPHYRPFLAAMLPTGDMPSFVDLCIAFLSGKDGEPFSRILNGHAAVAGAGEIAIPLKGAWQDVLVIGHEGEGTGLSRNFRMLTEGLAGEDVVLATLSYETEPGQFAERLRSWRHSCRSQPIVIAAVNAQDLPALFIRDRYGILDDCRIAGFFLWETSEVPRVQHLGTTLVDEIWVPTQYVANIYNDLAPTYVVGKGLFAQDAPVVHRTRPPGPLRFLTVFDFHSSIERKNPLASVLAFRRAFPGNEEVELIVKASNVNPQHPGNVFGQWERLCAEAAQDGRVHIITERYSEERMNALIAQVGCIVSFHRSEGFGYVLSDAMGLGIPVIATAYSGNVDFCNAETSFPVDCRLVPVNAVGMHWEGEGALWAEPDIDSAAAQMRRVYEDYPAALRTAAAGQRAILAKYARTAFAATLTRRLAAMADGKSKVDCSAGAVQ